LYPAQGLRWEAAKQGPAIRGITVEAGGAHLRIPETFSVQLCELCISPFIRGKYDFTSQFI
jgi:hypothetical protein